MAFIAFPYPPCHAGSCLDHECCVRGTGYNKFMWPELVGKNGDAAKAIIKKDNPLVTVLFVERGRQGVLDDFCCNRVYVFIDEKGNVYRTPVVG